VAQGSVFGPRRRGLSSPVRLVTMPLTSGPIEAATKWARHGGKEPFEPSNEGTFGDFRGSGCGAVNS
jgi:hypothetical protein